MDRRSGSADDVWKVALDGTSLSDREAFARAVRITRRAIENDERIQGRQSWWSKLGTGLFLAAGTAIVSVIVGLASPALRGVMKWFSTHG